MSEWYPSKSAPKSNTTTSPSTIRRSPGRAWGRPAFGTGGEDRLEARAGRPQIFHGAVELPGQIALDGPRLDEREHRSQGLARDGCRPLDPGDLAVVLGPALIFDHPARRRRRPAEGGGQPAVFTEGDLLGLHADRSPAGDQHHVVEELSRTEAHQHLARYPGRSELLAGLLAVPAVDHQHQSIGGEDGSAGRAGEPGQPLQVRQVGDQERVEAGCGEPTPDPVGPAVDGERGQRRLATHERPSFRAIAWTASS